MTIAIRRPLYRRPVAIAAALVAVGVVGAVLAFRPTPGPAAVANGTGSASPAATLSAAPSEPTPSASALLEATPTPLPSTPPPPLLTGIADLTGVRVDDALAHRLPIAILIDDNRVARPQSGFNGASIVYQAPADGGETRYMFVYGEADSRDIGPVRSGRIYFVHWAAEVRAAIAHYGGDQISRDYLAANNKAQFTNVDALGAGAHAFHRIKTRNPPHNGYTTTKAIRALALQLGGPATLGAEIFRRPFIDASAVAARAASQRIRIPYQTGVVEYAYDRARDLYLRSLDGRSQIDPADGKRVTTTNVVVLFQSFRTDSTIEAGHARPVIGDIGRGTAWVFREGRLLKGTWTKESETATTRLFDAAGKEIPLIRGRTFFQIVPEKLAVRATS